MNRESTYLRKYIILKKDYLNVSGINPKGHVKIESRGNKGNISVSIENAQEEKDYIISFLKEEGRQVKELNIGRIITDSKGKGRTNIPFNLRNLDLQGFSIGEISAILIRKDEDILLGGYIDKDRGTIERFIQEEKSIEEIETPMEEEIEKIMEIEVGTEPIFERETNLDMGEDFILEPEFKEAKLEIESELEVENELEFEMKEDSEEDGVNSGKTVDNYQAVENTRRLNHRNQMTNYILNILRFFPYVQPFKFNLNGYSWWQIEDDGTDSYKGFLPYFNYLMSTDYKYPFLNNSITCFDQIKKYGHYLFGMYKEKGETLYYIYGIPGRFAIEEHPFRGVTGFNTWYEAIEGMGYWLLYIDPMTGDIIHPLNPMIPSF